MIFSAIDATGTVIIFTYYAASAAFLILISRFFSIPREMLRKTYHLMCALSIFIALYCFERWWGAACAMAGLFAAAYLAMGLLQRVPAFRVIGRLHKNGEIRRQIFSVLGIFVLLITVFWGVLGPASRYHAAVGFMAWGVGDAFAAVFGKRFGKKRRWLVWLTPNKTLEGTAAMTLSSFAAIFLTLILLTPAPVAMTLLVSSVLAAGSGLVELVSREGWDTITVPPAVAFLSLLMVPLMAGLVGH